MELFKIKTAEDFSTIQTLTANSYATPVNFYISGSFINGGWEIGNAPLYSGAIPVGNVGCLVFNTTNVITNNCLDIFRPLCEFV
jgi:hypothetical protein